MQGKKISTFVSSPSIFYYDFCVIPPQHSYKAKQLLSVGTQAALRESAKPALKCSINMVFFLFALGGVLHATFVQSELWKVFILFVFSSFLTAHLFLHCLLREGVQ